MEDFSETLERTFSYVKNGEEAIGVVKQHDRIDDMLNHLSNSNQIRFIHYLSERLFLNAHSNASKKCMSIFFDILQETAEEESLDDYNSIEAVVASISQRFEQQMEEMQMNNLEKLGVERLREVVERNAEEF